MLRTEEQFKKYQIILVPILNYLNTLLLTANQNKLSTRVQ